MEATINILADANFEELSLEKINLNVQKTQEELERLTVDEKLAPIERAVYLLSSGQQVQQLSVVTSLPDLLKENNADCMRRVVPKVREVLYVAQEDMQHAACSSFLQILQQQLVPVSNFTQTFLQTIITSLDNRDPDIAKAWLDTLLDVIDLLPKDVLKKDILPMAISKGQLAQSVNSRMCACRILGKVVTKFEPFVIKKDILPVVQALCQDIEYEVRACMCRQLDAMSKGLGLEQTKSTILPELVELANDEEAVVRLAGLDTIVNILTLVDNETCSETIIPLVCKLCQQALNKEDSTLPMVSKQLGPLLHGMQSNLSDDQKKWFLDFYRKLCKIGVKDSDRPSNKEESGSPNRYPSIPMMMIPGLEDEDHTKETRRYAAYNFPALLLFIGPKSFKSELSTSFGHLVNDPSPHVRKAIAGGTHEVVKLLSFNCFGLLTEITALLRDDALEVLQSLFTHFCETMESYAKALAAATSNIDAKDITTETANFYELSTPLLKAGEVIDTSHNLRLQISYSECLGCLHQCYPSDLIHEKFIPVLLKKVIVGCPLPVRHSSAYSLLVLTRNIHRSDQRNAVYHKLIDELCRSPSCYRRYMFIDLCQTVMDLYSRTFFKDTFMTSLLNLHTDPVPNVRLRLCKLFPRLKKQLRLPGDRALLQQLETVIRKLLMSENDRDVKEVLEKAVKEADKMQVPMESLSKRSESEDDINDHKKELFEKHLKEQEEKEREEDAKLKKNGAIQSKKSMGPATIQKKGSTRVPVATGILLKSSTTTEHRDTTTVASDKHRNVSITSKGSKTSLTKGSEASSSQTSGANTRGSPSSASSSRRVSLPPAGQPKGVIRRSSMGAPEAQRKNLASPRKISTSSISDRKK